MLKQKNVILEQQYISARQKYFVTFFFFFNILLVFGTKVYIFFDIGLQVSLLLLKQLVSLLSPRCGSRQQPVTMNT